MTCLGENVMYPKLKVSVHFWTQFTPRKPKIMSKTRIFPETTSIIISNNRSTRFEKNNRNLIKLIEKNPFFGQKRTF